MGTSKDRHKTLYNMLLSLQQSQHWTEESFLLYDTKGLLSLSPVPLSWKVCQFEVNCDFEDILLETILKNYQR